MAGGGREGATNLQVRFGKPHSCFLVNIWLLFGASTVYLANRMGRRIISPRSVKALLHVASVNKLEPTWRAVFARLRVFPPHPLFRFTVFCISARQTDNRQGLLPRRASSEFHLTPVLLPENRAGVVRPPSTPSSSTAMPAASQAQPPPPPSSRVCCLCIKASLASTKLKLKRGATRSRHDRRSAAAL